MPPETHYHQCRLGPLLAHPSSLILAAIEYDSEGLIYLVTMTLSEDFLSVGEALSWCSSVGPLQCRRHQPDVWALICDFLRYRWLKRNLPMVFREFFSASFERISHSMH